MRRALLVALLAGGCTQPVANDHAGPLAQHASTMAQRYGVPTDLVLAVAQVEGGLRLGRWREVREDDDVPVAGILELRHGAYDSLARGAELMGVGETALREDTDLGTEAGIRVLAELGLETGARADDLGSWRRAVEEMSGLLPGPYRTEYLHDVFATLRDGGRFPARLGETVVIPPHPELGDDVVGPAGELDQALGSPPPDFPGAIWFPTDCTNKCTAGRPDGNAAVNTIVIHDTEGGWAGSVATLQFDAGKSVHYIVDADGSRVGQFLHETDTAWHAGNWCYNKHSIGIEHVGVASDPSGYSDGLYNKSVKLVKNIRSRWSVPLDRTHIIGHYQIPDGNHIPECSAPCTAQLNTCETSANYGGADNHRDPGYYWQWCQYMQLLGGSCTCNDAYSLWNCTTDKTEAVRCTNGQVQIEKCYPCESQPNGVNDICHPNPNLPGDLGSPSDGGVTSSDGGTPPADDLKMVTGDAGAKGDGGMAMVDGGCQCATGSRRGSGGLAALAVIALVALGLRRRLISRR